MDKKGMEWNWLMWLIIALILGFGLFTIIKNVIDFAKV